MSGIALSFLASGAGGIPYWIATLGGATVDVGRGVAVDSLNNIYVAGYTDSAGSGLHDFLITKYDSTGAIQWQRVLGAASEEIGFSVAVDSSGNVYITGQAFDVFASRAVFIAKYNTSGTLQWQRALGDSSQDIGYGIRVDGSGNVYVVGQNTDVGTGVLKACIAKYDTSGTLQWQRNLAELQTIAYAVTVDSSGVSYVTGYTQDNTTGVPNVFIAKYDTSGALQWQRKLGISSDYSVGNGIAIDSSSNVYVAGNAVNNSDILVTKYNTSGTIQWQNTLSGVSTDRANAVTVDSSGNVYITGNTLSAGAGSNDLIIAKYNTAGVIQWQRVLGGASSDVGNGIALDALGNLCITGNTSSTGAGSVDVLLLKLPSDGSLTGTYGPWTYAASSLTSAASSLVSTLGSMIPATSAMTSFTSTLTGATSTLTSTVTRL